MTEKELEQHYEQRLKTILQQHCKIILNDRELSQQWKMEHLEKISRIMEEERKSKDER